MASFINAAIWIAFAPISSITAEYYGVSTTAVNMLSVVFMILYVPGTFLANWSFSRLGLRGTMVLSALINFIGSAMRFASVDGDGAPSAGGYPLLLAGQALCGLVQPIFVNSTAKIAAAWFPVSQRDVATTIGSMANPIGTGIGQILPTLLVSANGGMPALLLCQCAASGVVLAAVYFFFQDRPPTPPSLTETMRYSRRVALGGEEETACDPRRIRELLGNRSFLLLAAGFSVGLAYFNSLLTVLGQQIAPLGYTTDDAGVFGVLILGCGLLGCAVVGPIMDSTHRYKTVLRSLGVVGIVAVLALCANLRPDNGTALAAIFALLGFVMLPLLPCLFECVVECTYPCPEEVSNGITLALGNVISIGTTFLWQELIRRNRDGYHGVWVSYNYLQVAMMGTAMCLLVLFDGEYLRLKAESEREAADIDADTNPSADVAGINSMAGFPEA